MYERNNVIRQFENAIAQHCHAPYAIAVESCTAALYLSCLYCQVKTVILPKRTYFSVPLTVMKTGGQVIFKDIKWSGAYQLYPYQIIDSAVRFKRDMYIPGNFMCLSFHYSKHIPIGRGGMILTDDKKAAKWFRLMRNDGRDEIPKEVDDVELPGFNFYMTPEQASRGLSLYYWRILGKPDQPDIDMGYSDLTKHKVFKYV